MSLVSAVPRVFVRLGRSSSRRCASLLGRALCDSISLRSGRTESLRSLTQSGGSVPSPLQAFAPILSGCAASISPFANDTNVAPNSLRLKMPPLRGFPLPSPVRHIAEDIAAQEAGDALQKQPRRMTDDQQNTHPHCVQCERRKGRCQRAMDRADYLLRSIHYKGMWCRSMPTRSPPDRRSIGRCGCRDDSRRGELPTCLSRDRRSKISP